MLDNIVTKCLDKKKLQTIRFIHSGLQSYVILADRPTKYITRIQKSKNYCISSDISNFGSMVLPAIYIAWVIKEIVKSTLNNIKETNLHNTDNNIEDSAWLQRYWDESEDNDIPAASSSQEKVIISRASSIYRNMDYPSRYEIINGSLFKNNIIKTKTDKIFYIVTHSFL